MRTSHLDEIAAGTLANLASLEAQWVDAQTDERAQSELDGIQASIDSLLLTLGRLAWLELRGLL